MLSGSAIPVVLDCLSPGGLFSDRLRITRPIGVVMSGNRILWGQITLVLAVVLATTWTATQWTAWRLGFQPQLGQPWFELVPGMPVYYPPAFFWWWYAYDAYAPPIFVEGARLHRGVRRIHRHRGRHHLVDPAGARSEERRHLWFGALGHRGGNPRGRIARPGRCHPRLPCR